MNSICARDVSKAFGEKTVLKNITVTIDEGEIFGLLGPSGAGKTTLIKILTGQLGYNGKAQISGKDCSKVDYEMYRQIGMAMDNSGIYKRLTCFDNLMLFARIYGKDKREVKKILDRVGLGGSRTTAGKLSKGMTQRLILARAVLHNPRILFLDEPTSGLDPATSAEIHNLLIELKNQGTTIFLTTHNMEEAYKLCDHIALLNEGEIVEYGVPDELCRKYNQENQITILCHDGSSILLQNKPENADKIRDIFAGGKVDAIHSSEPNLETVFMKLTGRGLE